MRANRRTLKTWAIAFDEIRHCYCTIIATNSPAMATKLGNGTDVENSSAIFIDTHKCKTSHDAFFIPNAWIPEYRLVNVPVQMIIRMQFWFSYLSPRAPTTLISSGRKSRMFEGGELRGAKEGQSPIVDAVSAFASWPAVRVIMADQSIQRMITKLFLICIVNLVMKINAVLYNPMF